MRLSYTQVEEIYARWAPSADARALRASYEAIASRDGDVDSLSERDLEPEKVFGPRPALALVQPSELAIVRQVALLVESERAALYRSISEDSILALLRLSAGQPKRLRVLGRDELCDLADQLRREAPLDAFRFASILSDAIVAAARDPRLDQASKERVISDSCAGLLRLSAEDVAFAFRRCEPRGLELLTPQDRARVETYLATIPRSMFDPK